MKRASKTSCIPESKYLNYEAVGCKIFLGKSAMKIPSWSLAIIPAKPKFISALKLVSVLILRNPEKGASKILFAINEYFRVVSYDYFGLTETEIRIKLLPFKQLHISKFPNSPNRTA